MNLTDLLPAIKQIAAQSVVSDLRAFTYMATYPSILALGATPGPINMERFHQFALMAYGWMPRIVRLDPQHMENALESCQQAQAVTTANRKAVMISAIADCLHSVVGASKVLHFIKPDVFPIWDSNIEQFRKKDVALAYKHMDQVANYSLYVDEVHAIRLDSGFQLFYDQFNVALAARLVANNITPYQITEVRAIEAAAFELA